MIPSPSITNSYSATQFNLMKKVSRVFEQPKFSGSAVDYNGTLLGKKVLFNPERLKGNFFVESKIPLDKPLDVVSDEIISTNVGPSRHSGWLSFLKSDSSSGDKYRRLTLQDEEKNQLRANAEWFDVME